MSHLISKNKTDLHRLEKSVLENDFKTIEITYGLPQLITSNCSIEFSKNLF